MLDWLKLIFCTGRTVYARSLCIGLSLLLTLSPRGWASDCSNCTTPARLMEAPQTPQFTRICEDLVKNDPGCQQLKPENRMRCSSKASNNLLSSSNLLEKAGQCLKGFFYDSLVELGKFVIDLIGMLVSASVNSVVGITKFLTNSEYRAKALESAKSAGDKGFRMIRAFMNSSAMYFAREYPRNLAKHPLNPALALGQTLFGPLVKLMVETGEALAEHFIPQYQCLNGAAKANTICRVFGEFFMPPAFVFGYLKLGVRGLRTVAQANPQKISRARNGFRQLNELPPGSTAKAVETSSRSTTPAAVTVTAPRPSTPAGTTRPARSTSTSTTTTTTATPPRQSTPTATVTTPKPSTPAVVSNQSSGSLDELTKVIESSPVDKTLVGAPTPIANSPTLRAIELPEVSPQVLESMLKQSDYKILLKDLPAEQKVRAAIALKVFESGGLTQRQSAQLYQKYESTFKTLSARSPAGDRSSEALLAQFIKKQKKNGLSDDVIRKKIDDAFVGCK
jgi:hypothetical protein